jgi:hypothetical protein
VSAPSSPTVSRSPLLPDAHKYRHTAANKPSSSFSHFPSSRADARNPSSHSSPHPVDYDHLEHCREVLELLAASNNLLVNMSLLGSPDFLELHRRSATSNRRSPSIDTAPSLDVKPYVLMVSSSISRCAHLAL